MTVTPLERRATATERRLRSRSTLETETVDRISHYRTASFERPEDLPLGAFHPCDVGFIWERGRETVPDDRRSADVDPSDADELPDELALGENVWFRLQFAIPASMAGHPVDLRFEATPVNARDVGLGTPRVECLCYRDGDPWHAFDDGHADLRLVDDANGGETFDLLVEAGTTTLWGQLDVDQFVLETADLRARCEPVAELTRHVTILNELAEDLPADSVNREKILRGIQRASHAFEYDAPDESTLASSAADALDVLRSVEHDLTSELTGHELTAVGHAHLDLAWLWPWSETVRKGARTFSTVSTLLERRPNATFVQSQPHLYELVGDRYPAVFERLTDHVESGSWQPEGALWVEADVDMAGPEALARQFLYGTRYFRETFDVDPEVAFLPDVFGYPATLPTVARAADVPYFLTQKMSWNDTNDFPYTSFTWEGLDGSTVLSHLPPADTYNGDMSVTQVREAVTNDNEAAVTESGLYLYGFGDGGGGPTREMIDRREILDDIGSLPDLTNGTVEGFFDRLSAYEADLPTWVGEMYLEKHRGTLTTQARTKRSNRTGEVALREADLAAVLAMVAGEYVYPHERLELAWKGLLFNQFHDILPGSSVAEVYADADRDYEVVFDRAESVRETAVTALSNARSYDGAEPRPDEPDRWMAVLNPVSWSRSPVVSVDAEPFVETTDGLTRIVGPDGTARPVQANGRPEESGVLFEATKLPPLGVVTFAVEDGDLPTVASSLEASPSHLQNAQLRLEFLDDGRYFVEDRDADRRPFDGPANRLVCYRDQPADLDAWDIEGDVFDVSKQLPSPSTVEVLEDGPLRATVRQTFEFGNSRLVQDISLTRKSRRIDHRTMVDWQADETLLKARFPVNVHANEATFDVQFGHVERATHENTSWDRARYEVPHQQWVDVSETEYGVAVLNDCKHGVDVDGTNVGLSLLRSPRSPDPDADRGQHEFTYAVYPHRGDHVDGGVVEAGYAMNNEPEPVAVDGPVEYSLLSVDQPGVVVESVKRAEDDPNAFVVRLYEAYGRRIETALTFGAPVDNVEIVSIVEDHRESLATDDDRVSLSLDAFDLRTIRVTLEDD